MIDRYVLLTGGRNNAGDYLIKYRAKQLLSALRPDRTIVDYDAWKLLTPEQLEVINQSRALLLTGGPSLQYRMRPSIYPMVEDLNRIRAPIIMMGIGWKSPDGSWESTHRYPLSPATLELLKRIDKTGYSSSVRDYHTANVLFHYGLKNVLMTGCPALYSLEHIGKASASLKDVKKVSVSLGASFVHNTGMEQAMKRLVLELRERFKSQEMTVTFHHSLNREQFVSTYNGNRVFLERHLTFADWLRQRGIPYVDISGSEQKLIEHYSRCDLHVGYRVHAHIFMSSVSKPSILINEDGRGRALRDVTGGICLDGYTYSAGRPSLLGKVKSRLFGTASDSSLRPSLAASADVLSQIEYEIATGFPRIGQARGNIDRHFDVMRRFIAQLP